MLELTKENANEYKLRASRIDHRLKVKKTKIKPYVNYYKVEVTYPILPPDEKWAIVKKMRKMESELQNEINERWFNDNL